MVRLLICSQYLAPFQPSTRLRVSVKPSQLSVYPAVSFNGYPIRRNSRSLEVVTRAGPSASSYVFAFVFPLSLLVVTVFTALRIGDKLDRDYLEELALNQAIMEEAEEEAEGKDLNTSFEEKPAIRKRSRPKREA